MSKASKKEIIIDNHCHIFNHDCIATELTGRFTKDIDLNPIKKILKYFHNWFDDNDPLDRLREFITLCKMSNTTDTAEALLNESKFKDKKKQLVFTLLMMDTEYAVKDHSDADQLPKKDFARQKKEMTAAVLKHPGRFLPFIAADPRRIEANKKKEKERKKKTNDPHGIKYITNALETQGFWGVKIYPPLGYLPNDSRLHPLYEYCEENGIPITTHCLHGGFYSDEKVPKKKNQKKKPEKDKHYWAMANPENWKPVLDKYKGLKLNLAHFGGDIFATKGLIFKRKDKAQINIERKWRETIEGYLKKYDNVYADLAYIEAMFKEPGPYFRRLKKYSGNNKIWNKILYGTDWWPLRILCSESEHLNIFNDHAKKYGIQKSLITRLLKGNAVKFLGLNNSKKGPLFNHTNFLKSKGKKLPGWFKFS